jgi:hypothetical protein
VLENGANESDAKRNVAAAKAIVEKKQTPQKIRIARSPEYPAW